MVVQSRVGMLSKGGYSDEDDVNLATSRKQLGAARKENSIKATARCAKLFGLIKQKKWDEFLQNLEYHESDARQWIEEKNDDNTTRWRSLLIHLVRTQ